MSISLKADPSGTFGEILVNGQVVAKLPVTGNAVIPNLVGTVSQSGGVPTGAIIERGSNANGEYVRFADGTQICRSNSVVLSTYVNNRRFSGTWTFPAVFSSAGSTVTHTTDISYWFNQGYATDSITGSSAEAITTTSAGLDQQSTGSFVSGKSTRQYAIAIGRWY